MKVVWCHSSDGVYGGIQRVDEHIKTVLQEYSSKLIEHVYAPSGGIIGKLLETIKLINTVHEEVKNADIAVFSHVKLAHRCMKSLRQSAIPYIVFLHGLEFFEDKARTYSDVLKGANAVICNSAFCASLVSNMYGIQQVNQWYFPGLNIELSGDTLEKVKLKQVLMVGRMMQSEQYKGHEQVLKAWPSVTQSHPDASLIIVGDGDHRGYFQHMAKRLHNVHFYTKLSDEALAALYHTSALFCLPSRKEGQGLAYLEALQAGLPVIALKNSPASEFIAHNNEGILLNEQSPEEIGAAISFLFTNEEERDAMATAARKRSIALDVERTFSTELTKVLTSCVA